MSGMDIGTFERGGFQQFLDPVGQECALVKYRMEWADEAGDDQCGSVRAGNHGGLFVERGEDVVDRRVFRVGLGLAGMKVGDPPHRQAGQMGDMPVKVAGDGRWQGSDGGDLVDDDQDGAVFGLQFDEDFAEFGFAVGRALVEGLLAGGGECGGVVSALADVQAEVDVDAAGIDHVGHPSVLFTRLCHGTDRHIHIKKSLPACEKGRYSCQLRRPVNPLRVDENGDGGRSAASWMRALRSASGRKTDPAHLDVPTGTFPQP
ncbi:hypothetical protein ACVWXU_000594 [Streptomyces sp. TE33382]